MRRERSRLGSTTVPIADLPVTQWGFMPREVSALASSQQEAIATVRTVLGHAMDAGIVLPNGRRFDSLRSQASRGWENSARDVRLQPQIAARP